MGGCSSKKKFFWQKKKRSPLQQSWRQLKGALPGKKRKKKIPLPLDKLNLDNLKRRKRSQRKFSLSTDKKDFVLSKRFSLGNTRKESTVLPGKKDGGRLGEQIKKRLSLPL